MIPINILTSSFKGVRWYQGFLRVKQVVQIILFLVAGACYLLHNKYSDNSDFIILTICAISIIVFIEISFRILVWIIKGFLPHEKVAD
jgi:hypothetical protein